MFRWAAWSCRRLSVVSTSRTASRASRSGPPLLTSAGACVRIVFYSVGILSKFFLAGCYWCTSVRYSVWTLHIRYEAVYDWVVRSYTIVVRHVAGACITTMACYKSAQHLSMPPFIDWRKRGKKLRSRWVVTAVCAWRHIWCILYQFEFDLFVLAHR